MKSSICSICDTKNFKSDAKSSNAKIKNILKICFNNDLLAPGIIKSHDGHFSYDRNKMMHQNVLSNHDIDTRQTEKARKCLRKCFLVLLVSKS